MVDKVLGLGLFGLALALIYLAYSAGCPGKNQRAPRPYDDRQANPAWFRRDEDEQAEDDLSPFGKRKRKRQGQQHGPAALQFTSLHCRWLSPRHQKR